MKYKILPFTSLVLSFLFAYQVANAQCVPFNFPGTELLYPDTSAGLPNGFTKIIYDEAIFVKVPATYVFQGFPVAVDSIQLVTVSGLPSGFYFTPNKVSKSWVKNELGCVSIHGTAAQNQIGIYNVKFTLKAFLFGQTTGFDLVDMGNYKFRIYDSAQVNISSVNRSFEQITNLYPNPMTQASTVEFLSESSKSIHLEILNILGSVVYGTERNVNSGLNKIQIEKSGLPAGMYWVRISTENNKYIKKLIIQ